MTEQRTIAFSKMSGLGNDFIIIDARENTLALAPEQVRRLATHSRTQGCDQLLVLHPPKSGGDIFMQIFNADGGEVEACGNGARAVAAWFAKNGNGEASITMETLGGQLTCQFFDEHANVIMPTPKFGWRDIPLNKAINDTAQVQLHEDLPPAFLVNVGNPHAVFFMDTQNVETIDTMAKKYGEELVHHPLFAQGANINFAFIGTHINDHIDYDIHIATWERGVGLTQACGTGACAATIATIHLNLGAQKGIADVYTPFARQNSVPALYQSFICVEYEPESGKLSQHGTADFEFNGMITL